MATGIHFNTKRERDAYHDAGGEFDYSEPPVFHKKNSSHKANKAIRQYEKAKNEVVSKAT